jgi:hypothetical protein
LCPRTSGRLAVVTNFDEDDRRLVAAEAQSMVSDRDDARSPRPHHANRDTLLQPHFGQTHDGSGVAVDPHDLADIASDKSLDRYEMRLGHEAFQMRLNLSFNISS